MYIHVTVCYYITDSGRSVSSIREHPSEKKKYTAINSCTIQFHVCIYFSYAHIYTKANMYFKVCSTQVDKDRDYQMRWYD